VLDDIRLAVVDAFFSLPRGGAEIGGILLGRVAPGRISVLDYRALDCEHATGPSFTLSQNDLTQLSTLLAEAKEHPEGLRAVGWYHSHTRSEIFLSDADVEIHQRFFPEKWQIALVLKPSTFEPTRGGFFFREADGSIHGAASYHEFSIEAQPIRQVPGGAPPEMPAAQQPLRRETEARGPVITLTPDVQRPAAPVVRQETPAPEDAPEPVAEAADAAEEAAENKAEEGSPESQVREFRAPQFLQIKPERSWRWVKIAAALALGAGLGVSSYQTREAWLPPLVELASPLMARIRLGLPKEAVPAVKLAVSDQNGQLAIQWDGRSPAIQKAGQGVLEIADGNGSPQSIPLGKTQLEAGAFTYSRQAERVEVRMKVGSEVNEVANFLGKLPDHKQPAEDPAVRQERDELRQESTKLKGDLELQAAKTRKLEKALNDVKEQLAKEAQRRMANQLPDPGKK
jgi:proteasome lid subunit RPN8/RPN11